jgi:ribosomal protein S18 acetylase RimI-like enzyme
LENLDLDLPQLNNVALQFKRNVADADNMIQHWKACDSAFFKHLSERVDLENYAEKIQLFAQRVEAWHEGELVGFLAFYANNVTDGVGYITSISVVPKFGGKRIGHQLFDLCYRELTEKSFKVIQLHVADTNAQAIDFYKRIGFVATEQQGGFYKMEMKIN